MMSESSSYCCIYAHTHFLCFMHGDNSVGLVQFEQSLNINCQLCQFSQNKYSQNFELYLLLRCRSVTYSSLAAHHNNSESPLTKFIKC